MSRGTAKSTMNIGRRRRFFTPAPPRPNQHRQGAGGATNHSIEFVQTLRQIGQAQNLTAKPRGQPLAPFQSAVGMAIARGLRAAKCVAAQLNHFASTDKQDPDLGEILKQLACQPDRARRHTDGMCANFGGRSHFLGHREGALEHLDSVLPKAPASSAARTASLSCPRICGSPSTIESRPLATRNAWRRRHRLADGKCGSAARAAIHRRFGPARQAFAPARHHRRRSKSRSGCRWRRLPPPALGPFGWQRCRASCADAAQFGPWRTQSGPADPAEPYCD